MMTTMPRNSLFIDLVIIVVGVLMLIFRNEIGSFTGYYAGRGRYIDKSTPGCLLIPFALAFIIGGAILLIRNIMGG
jgi:hypothetical protein